MDRKGRFAIEDQIVHSHAVEKVPFFDPNFFDRTMRSAHPVKNVDFFNGMRGSDCSIEKLFQAHRISHHPTKHTITPYTPCNSSDRCWLDCYSTAAAAAHNDSAWHILFSARQQRVPSSEKHQFVLSMTFLQHCCCSSCCCALFGYSRRSPTPQLRRCSG